jgi:hypothetical protein
MPLFKVTLQDDELTRGWPDLEQDDGEPARYMNESFLEVEADDAKSAKAFAEEHNPGLTATDAKAIK